MKDSYMLAQIAFLAMSTGMDTQQFVRISAHDFFWGYEDTLFSLARTYSSLAQELPHKKFGILMKVSSMRRIPHHRDDMHQYNFITTINIAVSFITKKCQSLDRIITIITIVCSAIFIIVRLVGIGFGHRVKVSISSNPSTQ
jgi:hypothetical protein